MTRTRSRVTTAMVFALGLGAVGLVGTLVAGRGGSTIDELSVPMSTDQRIEDYPDSITRRLDRLAREPRPVEQSALPPRHLDTATFPVALVDRSRIVSGGPPPDGIPAIDDPVFEQLADVDWIDVREPVLMLDLDGTVRVYPLQVMMWHEIVNDVVDGRPVTITYCPLCNTGIAYERRYQGRDLDFGVSGSLYQSAMVMYDRQTESLWTHVDGRAVVGQLVGAELEMIPVAMVGWADVVDAHPEALVLSRTTALMARYGENPYGAYGNGDVPLPGFFTGPVDARLAPMTRVVGIRDGELDLAVPIAALGRAGTAAVAGDGRTLTVWHLPGTPWAIGAPRVGGAVGTGATAVLDATHDGVELTFRRDGDRFVDDLTGSNWNIFGVAVDGPLVGTRLDPVVHVDTFWFAWSTFRPSSEIIDPTGVGDRGG